MPSVVVCPFDQPLGFRVTRLVRRVYTDNAKVYRIGADWGWVCSAWQLKRRFTKPGCRWTNGKAERFNRTLLTE